MIFDNLPQSIKYLYLKMQTAESLAGYLDALRELLQELEYTKETKKAYEHIKKSLQVQEDLWTEAYMKSMKWVTTSLDKIKKMSPLKLKKFIKEREDAIKNGTPGMFAGATYFEMMFNVLEAAVNLGAQYGEHKAIEGLFTSIEVIDDCLSFIDDPFKELNIQGTILQGTAEGDILEAKLGHGFIEAVIIEPSEWQPRRQYQIKKGRTKIKLPQQIEDCMKEIQRRISPEMRDRRPALHLHTLQLYAYWRDWMDADRRFPANPSEKQLMQFYNQMTMIGRLQLDFSLKGGPESTREGLTKVLDRFLVCVLCESNQSKLRSKERAFRYAYGRVKEILMSLTIQERNGFTYKEIISRILKDAKLEELSFSVKESNCIEACKQFAKEYKWMPSRKASRSKG